LPYAEGFADLGGVKVFHRCWVSEPVDILVVGVHGFAEHGGRYRHVGEALLGAGYSFCIHDLRSHGRTAASDEERGYVESFDDFLRDLRLYISYVAEQYKPRRVALLGHSMGGLIVLHYMARIGAGVDAAVTSGAAAIVRVNPLMLAYLKIVNALRPRMRVDLPIRAEYLTHDAAVARAYLEDPLVVKRPTVRLIYELVKASREVWRYIDRVDKPIMLLHGGKDLIVPPEASTKAYERIRSRAKELKVYPELYHEILNEPQWKNVLSDILQWLNRVLGS